MMKWSSLNKLGQSRLLRSSWIWLVIVPVVSRAMASVQSPLDFSRFVPGLRLDLTLPFSWHRFYISALLVAIAGGIYALRCPEIVKRFETYADFEADGRAIDYLNETIRKLCLYPEGTTTRDLLLTSRVKIFWEVYSKAEVCRPGSQAACLALYFAGLVLAGSVFLQNVTFVLGQFSSDRLLEVISIWK